MVKKYPHERSSSTHVGLRLPNKLYAELVKEKKALNISLSEVIVQILEKNKKAIKSR